MSSHPYHHTITPTHPPTLSHPSHTHLHKSGPSSFLGTRLPRQMVEDMQTFPLECTRGVTIFLTLPMASDVFDCLDCPTSLARCAIGCTTTSSRLTCHVRYPRCSADPPHPFPSSRNSPSHSCLWTSERVSSSPVASS